RWLHLPGFSLQPSEFVKPAFVVVAAWLMSMQKIKERFPGNLLAVALYGLVVFLLLMQPDFGMTTLITIGLMTVIFIAGLRFRFLFILIGLGVVGALFAYLSFDHIQSRVNRFLDPESGDNYQVERSIEAFQSGGIMGAGPGQGVVKLGLPDAHADFIFSVAGEEMGLIFVLVIVFIYGFIVFRGLSKMDNSDDLFSVLATGGLLTIFGFQAFIHMGSALSLLPAKGMTLPFISYGGSSLLSTAYTAGVILALTKRTKRSGISKGGLSM
ncbi:FtsW/RodA/SpoVE family cell cycle protein, partial [Alphaproteobacteria bacterium]|nr:FtsW/RodA/SpoVE family cell cycle protein [Alphaproteobacteria bacterium]